MTERPILFNAPMVRALLDGTKTQTRRVVKDLPPWEITEIVPDAGGTGKWLPNGPAPSGRGMASGHWRPCPYGQPGDRLWVREDFALSVVDPDVGCPDDDPENWDVIYRADPDQPGGGWTDGEGNDIEAPWQGERDMPRWASRILLEVVSVHVERLQDISDADVRAEGVRPREVRQFAKFGASPEERAGMRRRAAIAPYTDLWESIYGAGSWDANPWVWVVEFKRVTP